MLLDPATISDGVSQRLFTVGEITGALWTPVDAPARLPLVLLGHGGGQHRLAPGMLARAHRYTTGNGFAVAAIDAPGHGDRLRTDYDRLFATEIRAGIAAGEPVAARIASDNADRAIKAVPEWRAVLDELQQLDEIGPDGPVGYWGVSLGTAIGVPLVAAEPRITAAVFGLLGHEVLAEPAGRITAAVEFLVQWDDELISRDSALALFDAFGSAEKSLHANPGRHAAVPRYEVDSSQRFFARHLTGAGRPSG